MYPLTSTALAMLSRSHGVTAELRASVNGSGFTYPVVLESGSVSVSSSSAISRTLSARVAADIGDPEVDVFRTELRAFYGLTGINGITEWVPVGTFVVTDARQVGKGVVEVRGEDRWCRVRNARLLHPLTTSGWSGEAIVNLVQGADGRIVCTDLTGSLVTHGRSVWERDRDKAVLDLARSIGAQVVFDVMGAAQIRPVPSLSDPVVWRVYGGDGGVLVEARRGASQSNTYNAAVVEGESTEGQPSVRSVRFVLDPASPLLFGGPFATRPRFYRSSLIGNQQQADLAADALLARVTGIARTVTVDAAPHPGLDAGDVIDVEVAPGVFERHIVDAFTLPLGPGAVSLETRSTVGSETEGES